MWRLHGYLGRVLNRCHGSAPLRLSQNHHVEDEVLKGSTELSAPRHASNSSSQKGEDGEKRQKEKTFHFFYARLPRYTALDAVGWGAATVLFMQMCRRIHYQFASGTDASPGLGPCPLATPTTLHKCGYRILLEALSRQDVLSRERGSMCLHVLPERQNQRPSQIPNSRSAQATPPSSTDQERLEADAAPSNHQASELRQDSALQEESWNPEQQGVDSDCRRTPGDGHKNILSEEEQLTGAASNLSNVADSSVPVILNIIGLESAANKNHEAAFSCFLAAAQHGYSKAQFNAGVCYERGWGVSQDRDKALSYYWQAAVCGHAQAQYRYAKLLLTSRRRQSGEEWDTAVSLLEQAATSGLTEAQLYLGSVFSQGPVRDGRKCVHYLKMAAETGDGTALLFLGQCYESGFGVQPNLSIATGFYEKAARAGSKRAKSFLTQRGGGNGDAALRSIRSTPSFSGVSAITGHPPSSSHRPVTLPLLPHAWSTGSLCSPLDPASTPLHLHPHPQASGADGGPCRWTLGIE